MCCQQARCFRTVDLSSSGSSIPALTAESIKHINAPLKALHQLWTEDQEISIIFIKTHRQLDDAQRK